MIEKIYKNKYMVTCDNCGTGLLDKATEIGRLRDELVKSLKVEEE